MTTKRKLMAIFAHPDDEGAMGGTLAYYAAQADTDVMLVCGTRGEVGEISDPVLATPETLGEVRQQELEAACAVLGIEQLAWLDYRDSGMDGTPPNEDPRALVQADSAEIKAKITALIRQFQPDIVVTFEPFGWYGHPDHKAVSLWATEAYHEMNANEQPQRLYHSVIPFTLWGAMMEEATAAGHLEEGNGGIGIDIPQELLLKTEAAVTHQIPVADFYPVKETSRACHKTQFGPDSLFSKIPREMMQRAMGNEHFIQVHPEPDAELRVVRSAELFPD